MATLLTCDGISKSFGLRSLFTNIALIVNDGEKIGMIGPNGSGKSTLLKIIAGLEGTDAGELTTKRQLRMAYVPQDDLFAEDATVEGALLEALQGSALEPTERQVQVDVMLGRTGFTERAQLVATLSGGWKKRLSIACALITDPELLLLDEPTNHLDLEGILWLEGLLKAASFAVLLVSHDRYLLQSVTTRIVEISRGYPDGYFSVNGAYSDFLMRRAEFLSAQSSLQQSLNAKVRQEVAWLQRGARARTTKAKGRIEDAMQLIDDLSATKIRNAQTRTVALGFDATGRKTKRLLFTHNLGITLGGRTLFSKLDLTLSSGLKLGLLGANGSGKTTLLRLLTGELMPDEGTVKHADGLRVVYFQQNRQELDLTVTLREALAPGGDTITYRGKPMHVAGWAKKFLFESAQLGMRVSELSGGERSRILLARMMLQPADVLILDEPTNDLDIPSLEVLEESLDDFPGTLVLVTHDRFMLDRLCNQLLALDGEGHAEFFAEYAQWERKHAEKDAPAPPAALRSAAKIRPAAPVRKKLSWKEERELDAMEETILAAEAEVERLEHLLVDPEVMVDYLKVGATAEQLHTAQEQVKQLYARWAELDEKRQG